MLIFLRGPCRTFAFEVAFAAFVAFVALCVLAAFVALCVFFAAFMSSFFFITRIRAGPPWSAWNLGQVESGNAYPAIDALRQEWRSAPSQHDDAQHGWKRDGVRWGGHALDMPSAKKSMMTAAATTTMTTTMKTTTKTTDEKNEDNTQ